MSGHYVVTILSSLWVWGIVGSVLYIVLGMMIFKAQEDDGRLSYSRILGAGIIAIILFTQIYFWLIADIWDVRQSLPLQLCDMSFILCGLALLTRHKFLFEWALLVGFPAAVHSILTPELTRGFSSFLLFEYYFSHASQILAPLVLTLYFGMRPRIGSWQKVFAAVNVVLAIVFVFDWAFDANYIYLMEKPAVDNPLLVGPWPWYILGVEIAGFVHIILFYWIFRKTRWFAPKLVGAG